MMRRTIIARAAAFAALLAAAFSTAACARRSPIVIDEGGGAFRGPETLLLRADEMARGRELLRRGNPAFRAAYDALIRDADSALTIPPPSVVAKKRTPPSGDKHDYMSLAPYWWPDPSKPNGLPFIRRDGDVNPESRLDTDGPRFSRMADAVEALTLGYYYSGQAEYASRAALLLRTWFLDSATRMNPNLRYAQAIPGVTDGRGIGIIDTRSLPNIIDDVILLRGASGWTSADEQAMRAWCAAYLAWMQASPQGKEEAIQRNNHGTWYDSQLAALALFVGDTALARRTIAGAGPGRVATQIAPDGSQPEELARTRPIHYTLFNLEPFARLAELGRHVNVDLWNYRAPNGASIHQSVLWVAPYLDSARKWTGPEITPAHPEEFVRTIRQAARAYRDPRIDAALRTMPAAALRDDRSRLLYPEMPSRVSPASPAPQRPVASPLDTLIPRVLRTAAANLSRAVALDPAAGYPRATRADGSWDVLPAGAWTSGFFSGTLWQMYDLTRDERWQAQAARWTAGLESNKTRTNTHDLGFMIFDSFGQGLRITGDPHYRDVILTASSSLVRRFNPAVGAIKSWDTEQNADARATWQYPVIIDNLMNLEMLFWASTHGGDPAWRTIAERHALTSARVHVRADGSTAHVALFDSRTGALLRRATWQGYSDSSVWARGQAWAIYGFTRAYEETKNPVLLETAVRVADWYVAHLPSDAVPFWDFSDPAIPRTVRDASAGAIAASGLLALSRDVTSENSVRYRTIAERTLTSLMTQYLDTRPTAMALLAHSTGAKPLGAEVDVGLVYADYYLLEAIRRWQGYR